MGRAATPAAGRPHRTARCLLPLHSRSPRRPGEGRRRGRRMAVPWWRGRGRRRWRGRWWRWRCLGDHHGDGGVGEDVSAGLARLGDDRPGSIPGGSPVGDLRRQSTTRQGLLRPRQPHADQPGNRNLLDRSGWGRRRGGRRSSHGRQEKFVVGAGVAWPGSLGASSSLKATIPKTTSRAGRTTYQRRHNRPLDDGPVGGGDPHPADCCGGGSQPSGGPAGAPQPGACGGGLPALAVRLLGGAPVPNRAD